MSGPLSFSFYGNRFWISSGVGVGFSKFFFGDPDLTSFSLFRQKDILFVHRRSWGIWLLCSISAWTVVQKIWSTLKLNYLLGLKNMSPSNPFNNATENVVYIQFVDFLPSDSEYPVGWSPGLTKFSWEIRFEIRQDCSFYQKQWSSIFCLSVVWYL